MFKSLCDYNFRFRETEHSEVHDRRESAAINRGYEVHDSRESTAVNRGYEVHDLSSAKRYIRLSQNAFTA